MNFLFTSAGDNSNLLEMWKGEHQTYDIYVVYYGDSEEVFNKYKENVKWVERRKGSKFQNFYYFYNTYPEIIALYDRFFIMDDDIIINVSDINEMFSISKEYSLSICQPSFAKESIAYHPITRHIEGLKLQYTNFIEVNTPLYSKEALHNLMIYYDGLVVGAGIDFLSIWANQKNQWLPSKKFAVIHKISCINPTTRSKGLKTRELLSIDESTRTNTWWKRWDELSTKLKCPKMFIYTSFGNVLLSGEFEAQPNSDE